MNRMTIALGLCLGLMTTLAHGADSYPIRLTVPARPGDVAAISVKVKYVHTEKSTDIGNNKPPVNITFEAALKGTEIVDAVSDNNRQTKVILHLTLCTKDGDQLLPPGTTLTAENVNAEERFRVNGAAPTTDQKRVLEELIYTARPDEPTGVEEFGTDKLQKVGDTWRANGDQLARATHLPFHITGNDFNGVGKLAAVAMVDGKMTETIYLTDTCELPIREETNGTIHKNLKMKFEETLVAPIDSTVRGSTRAASRIISETVVDRQGTRKIHTELTREITYGGSEK